MSGISRIPDDRGEAYEKQLEQMLANGRRWMQEHPNEQIIVQFNFPRTVFVIAPIGEGLARHLVAHNDAGLELINALWPFGQGNENEPTVGMVRVVLENIVPKERLDAAGEPLPPQNCPTCGKSLDAVTGVNTDKRPSPGDFTLCGQCGEILQFADTMALRAVSIGELEQAEKVHRELLLLVQGKIREERRAS